MELLQVVALIIPGIAIFLQFYYSDVLESETGKITFQERFSEIHSGYLMILIGFSMFILSGAVLSVGSILTTYSGGLSLVGLGLIIIGFFLLLIGMLFPVLGSEIWEKITEESEIIMIAVLMALGANIVALTGVSILKRIFGFPANLSETTFLIGLIAASTAFYIVEKYNIRNKN